MFQIHIEIEQLVNVEETSKHVTRKQAKIQLCRVASAKNGVVTFKFRWCAITLFLRSVPGIDSAGLVQKNREPSNMAESKQANENDKINISKHIPELSHVPDLDGHFLDVMKTVEQAQRIIESSKEPFWGKLIRQLYLDGFTIGQMECAFKKANQTFKWTGQLCIWYQESKPTCIEQLQFANGDGNPEYVKDVIRTLIEENCQPEEEKEEPQPDEKKDENQDQPQNGDATANANAAAATNATVNNNEQPASQNQPPPLQ